MNTYQRKWLYELRHGGHLRGVGRLVSVDTDTGNTYYCCLGVAACHVFYEPTPDPSIGLLSELSINNCKDLGLTSDDEHALVGLNDGAGLTFSQIADVLELAFTTDDSVRTAARILGYSLKGAMCKQVMEGPR